MDSTEEKDKPSTTNTEEEAEADVAEQPAESQRPTPVAQRTSGRIRQKPKEWSPSGEESPAPAVVLPRPKDPRPSSAKSLDSDLSETPSNDIEIVSTPRVPRQRNIKRFSPSPPPSKKQVVDHSPANRTQPNYLFTPPDEIVLSDFKKTFTINGVYPSSIFKLDENIFRNDEDRPLLIDEEEDFELPDRGEAVVRKSSGMPPVSRPRQPRKRALSKKARENSEDSVSTTDDRRTPVADPSPTTSKPRVAAGAERSSKSSSRGPRTSEEFKVPLPSKRDSAPPSPAPTSSSRGSRAGSTVKEETEGTPSGRPTRKAAAFLHQFVAQVQGKVNVQASTSKNSPADQQSSSTPETAPVQSKKRRQSIAKNTPAEIPPPAEEEPKETPSKRKPKRKADEPSEQDQETHDSSPVEPKAKVKKTGSEPKEIAPESTTPVTARRTRQIGPRGQSTPNNRGKSTPKEKLTKTTSVKSEVKEKATRLSMLSKEQEVEDKPSSSTTGTSSQDGPRGQSTPKNRGKSTPKEKLTKTTSVKSEVKEKATRLSMLSKEQEVEDKPSSSTTGTSSQDEPGQSRSVRRSGRQSAPSVKLLEVQGSVDPTPRRTGFVKLNVKPKPGSALDILKKTTKFRANRSPTPELASPAPLELTTPEKKKEAASEDHSAENEATEAVGKGLVKEEVSVKEVLANKADEQKDEVTDEKTEDITNDDAKAPAAEEKPTVDQEDETNEDQNLSEEDSPTEPEEAPFSLSFVQNDEPVLIPDIDTSLMDPAHSPQPSTSKIEEENEETKEEAALIPPVKIKGGKGPMLQKSAPSKKAAAPKATPEPTRRSGRALRPNKLYEDFVGLETALRPTLETQHPETSKKAEALKKGGDGQKKAEAGKKTVEAKKEATVKKNEPKKQKKQEEPEVSSPIEESAAEKTRKLLNEHRPIKVLFKIGGEVSTSRVVGNTDEEPSEITPPPEDEVVQSEELSVAGEELDDEEQGEASVGDGTLAVAPSKKKEKGSGRYPAWWTNYVPSPKPVIENFVRPDGSVEKTGVSVNAIMDKILLAVCNDGITRNANKNSKLAKKEQLKAMASIRYHDKKSNVEPIEHLTPKKTSSELHAHTITTRERTKKAGLYKQNEYLLKPVKQQKQLAEDKEAQQRKALDYLSKQFHREAEEDLRNPPKENAYKPKKSAPKQVKRVTFLEFAAARGEKTKEMLLPSTKTPDTFHREILRDDDESAVAEDEEDEAVDVMDGAEEPVPDPVGLEEDAIAVANHIASLLMRPMNADGSFDVSDLYMRIQEEPPERRGAYDWAINEIVEFFVTQSSATGDAGRSVIHNEAMRHATMLQEAFSRVTQETSVWTHRFLIEHLPVRYLSSYLFLLRYLKFTAGTAFINLLVKASVNDYHPWPKVTEVVNGYVSTKVQDPDKEELQTTLSEFLPDVIFVMVPPSLSYNSSTTIKDKSHDVLFRWLKAVGDKSSILLDMDFESKDSSRHSILDALSEMTKYVKDTILKLAKQNKEKRIVLVGFRMSACLNHRVLTAAHGVSAVIDLAFPLKTKYGYRGSADDDINLTYAPTLFVMGADAPDFHPVALAKLRQSMICRTGSLIIHHADENLYVDNFILNKMGVTQRAVYRSILEGIVDFLRLDVTKQERVKLIPGDINNIYDLDVDALKTVATTASAQRPKPTPEQKAAQKEATAAAKRKRKAELYPPMAPVGLLPPMPSLHAETSGNSLSNARSRFDDIVKAASMGVPREVTHGVAKASPLPSPALPRDPLPQLLDPANISLN